MPATVHNGGSMTRSKDWCIPHMAHFCCYMGVACGLRTSENSSSTHSGGIAISQVAQRGRAVPEGTPLPE
jgi:hypothetical protein